MTNAPFASIDDFADLESVNHYEEAVAAGQDPEAVLAALRRVGRDNARTPMQWDDSQHAGFTTGVPWLPANRNSREVNAAAQRDDPMSVLAHYRRLIALRHTEPVVAHGDFRMLLPDDERVYAFTRSLDGVELLVLCNVSGSRVEVELPDVVAWTAAPVLIGNVDGGTGTVLQPWESRVHRWGPRAWQPESVE